MGRACSSVSRVKCSDCGKLIAKNWVSRHQCGKRLVNTNKVKELEHRIEQIQYCLIRAKVDLEYGMGFNRNKFYVDCMNEIEKACDWAFYKEGEENE
jgi:ribosomal protein S26